MPKFELSGVIDIDTMEFSLTGKLSTAPPTVQRPKFGVNLAGLEFGSAKPGQVFTDYVPPDAKAIDYYHFKGCNVFRIPFLWERCNDNAYLILLKSAVEKCTSLGATVIVDLHNYGRAPSGAVIDNPATFAELNAIWRKVSWWLDSGAPIWLGLMNEPHDQNTLAWFDAVQAVITDLRAAGVKNKLLVPGTAWAGAWNWESSGSSAEMLRLKDPANNLAIEVHQYFDEDGSGTKGEVVAGAALVRLWPFTDWCLKNKFQAFLGEFGAPASDAGCREIGRVRDHLLNYSNVWLGATIWAGGPWWGDYALSVEPKNGVDAPQLKAMLGLS